MAQDSDQGQAQPIELLGDRLRAMWNGMTGLGRWQVGLTLAAIIATLLTSVFFVRSTIAENQACYGVTGGKNPCASGVTPQVVENLVVVLAIVLGLYVLAALLALAQQRGSTSSARSAAFMFFLTDALLILGMTTSAIGGPGNYLLPSLALLLAAVVIGVVSQIRVARAGPPADEGQQG
jgi:hypothetical protein